MNYMINKEYSLMSEDYFFFLVKRTPLNGYGSSFGGHKSRFKIYLFGIVPLIMQTDWSGGSNVHNGVGFKITEYYFLGIKVYQVKSETITKNPNAKY